MVVPGMKLNEIETFKSRRFQGSCVRTRRYGRAGNNLSIEFSGRRPQHIFRRHFGRSVELLSVVSTDQFTSRLSLWPLPYANAVRRNCSPDRRPAAATPAILHRRAPKSPHSVTDVADLPTCRPKRPVFHKYSVQSILLCIADAAKSELFIVDPASNGCGPQRDSLSNSFPRIGMSRRE